jgi:NitT/TauT family transport system substrate-binding protein
MEFSFVNCQTSLPIILESDAFMHVARLGRCLIAALLASSLILPVHSVAGSTLLQIGSLGSDAGAEAFYAAELGFFRANGLSADVHISGNGAQITTAVLAGSLDIGYSNTLSIALAHERGLPVVMLYPGSGYDSLSPATVLMVATDSTIRSAKDLNGTTIAVNGLGTLVQLAVVSWIDENGGDAKSVHFVELNTSATFAAVKSHRVDAAIGTEPFLSANKNQIRVLAPGFDGISKSFVTGAWFTSKTFATEHSDLCKAFVESIRRTAIWANGHHSDSAKLLAKYSKISAGQLAQAARTPYPETIDLPQIQVAIDVAAKYNYLPSRFPVQEILFNPLPR